MNLMNKINKLEKDIKELKEEVKCFKNKDKSTTIKDIKIGEQFEYKGCNYTKLSNDNYCIIDDYDSSFMRCIFDPISNDYDESLVRQYINSDRFIKRLGVDKCDLKPIHIFTKFHFDGSQEREEDYIELLLKDDYDKLRKNIRNYAEWWMTSSYLDNDFYFYGITRTGDIDAHIHISTGGVRVCIILKPNTIVTRK